MAGEEVKRRGNSFGLGDSPVIRRLPNRRLPCAPRMIRECQRRRQRGAGLSHRFHEGRSSMYSLHDVLIDVPGTVLVISLSMRMMFQTGHARIEQDWKAEK
ncbi:hypothetical protein GJA_4975 [Janthinobacterium agaricidamnosum NBRC 102515 = DSM 9628]|uniref:Uncharacterized protein n=1 Tax=Janthinobacterium agaricidamnosum NBRC 102515 = DSM 9628 TaxID=1349767 RepID=W0VDW1_9BURK|nr:hypothetical protein GJA_4975 [Janthinobacterium agaricidamnosum NBRC 102515 = DSM 9628]